MRFLHQQNKSIVFVLRRVDFHRLHDFRLNDTPILLNNQFDVKLSTNHFDSYRIEYGWQRSMWKGLSNGPQSMLSSATFVNHSFVNRIYKRFQIWSIRCDRNPVNNGLR